MTIRARKLITHLHSFSIPVLNFRSFTASNGPKTLFIARPTSSRSHSSMCQSPSNPKYNVVLTNCTIGDFGVIHSGVCIGQDGFGFFVNEQGDMMKKPQSLKARIGNHVEIGANTCIDRGSWRDTVIGDHSKIDNLVQIGHNVVIGENCIICGQVGIAGSVTIGDYVTLGGRVAIRDHVCIASKVRLAANSCVTKNINKSGDYGGFPAIPIREWRKQVVATRQTSKLKNLDIVNSSFLSDSE